MKLTNSISISIIIPTLNEAACIGNLLEYIKANSSPKNIKEIIVVDGGSTDGTPTLAKTLGAKTISSEMGRAKQMNKGAELATGHVLYFLHADTYPPKDFDVFILNAVHQSIASGCFRMKFDTSKKFLRFFAWFSRINNRICRGGDQSLFIHKDLFRKTGGFNEKYII
ncbi:MAG: glycosyltransferase family 2 protein, partial [Arenibacter sp.]